MEKIAHYAAKAQSRHAYREDFVRACIFQLFFDLNNSEKGKKVDVKVPVKKKERTVATFDKKFNALKKASEGRKFPDGVVTADYFDSVFKQTFSKEFQAHASWRERKKKV